ncbi:hypothetical protein [Sphingobacterium detergens]|uniref:Uncharacterized protein n=1 Tax=Sphingobacterium detergens TaxID=1145106 RepID=A0A420ARK9_SPHD1|nr:hypothetical protein [Sphingobacterium detergens]RKE47119.1 hypothetical protein DFQ12_4280 [Sphingobacterium detergens]
MFNIIISALLLLAVVIGITLKLKNWKQRIVFLAVIFICVPLTLLYWYKWGFTNREAKLREAEVTCRQKKTIDELHILFIGYDEKDVKERCFSVHKNSLGDILDTNNHQVEINADHADFYYSHPLQADEKLEITIGHNQYAISNFVLTAVANYNMGGPVISGCRIDSADINGKRMALDQNIIIHKTDSYND